MLRYKSPQGVLIPCQLLRSDQQESVFHPQNNIVQNKIDNW